MKEYGWEFNIVNSLFDMAKLEQQHLCLFSIKTASINCNNTFSNQSIQDVCVPCFSKSLDIYYCHINLWQ